MISIKRGLPDQHRRRAAEIYWEAFGDKLALPLGAAEHATAYFEAAMICDRAIVAIDESDQLVGVAGFDLGDGGFISSETRFVHDIYGLSAWWRLMILAMFERNVEKGAMILDGIAVSTTARGQGIGGRLLDALEALAREDDMNEIWLDVIAGNPRAKALYLRHGFETRKRESTGIFRWILNFEASERMVKPLL